jgi:hypothetical protein
MQAVEVPIAENAMNVSTASTIASPESRRPENRTPANTSRFLIHSDGRRARISGDMAGED